MSNLVSRTETEPTELPVVTAPSTNGTHSAEPTKITEAESEAICIVAEYLRDAGLRNPDDIAGESRRIVAQAKTTLTPRLRRDPQSLAEAAIDVTVHQLEHWLAVLANDVEVTDAQKGPHGVVGARLPKLLAHYPQAFRGRPTTYEQIEQFGEHITPVVPETRPRRMHRQKLRLLPVWLRRWLKPEPADDVATTPVSPLSKQTSAASSKLTKPRLILTALTAFSTLPAMFRFWNVLRSGGSGWFDVPLTALFTILFIWIAFSFWTATLGLFVVLRRSRSRPPSTENGPSALPPTAVVMPIYNEDTASVFANIRACAEEVQAVGAAKSLHFFVLSDTTDPNIWLAEERAWAALAGNLPESVRVFYRHRADNRSRKAGNIAEFCQRWGGGYRYMIVLDADSVMSGPTLVEMVRRMERDPAIGILQVPPTPVDRHSLFARMQQFASRIYGPVFLEGFALWSQCDGNYWGHNAIIRIEPFMKHCDLPILPGDGPLGGEILSHDFVEAALMRRAGYKICLAHDLDGSYEQCPPTILTYAQRDQRWCQGNMQHLRLLLAEGFHPASRFHLGMGVLSYMASPLWLAFLVLTVIVAWARPETTAESATGGFALFAVCMSMLLLPKFWGVIAWRRHSANMEQSFTKSRLGLGVFVETAASMLIAPNMMLLHSWFVFSTFIGHKVSWNVQQRDDRGVSFAEAWKAHRSQMLVGIVAGAAVAWAVPGLLPWLLPVLVGLWLAVPLAMVLGSVGLGRSSAKAGVLIIPEEQTPPSVLWRRKAALAEADRCNASLNEEDLFAEAIADPAYYALHIGILRATKSDGPMTAEGFDRVVQRAETEGFSALAKNERRDALRDRRALASLHKIARLRLPRHLSPLHR